MVAESTELVIFDEPATARVAIERKAHNMAARSRLEPALA
jgi:hypothetical protein